MYYFTSGHGHNSGMLLSRVWMDVVGKPYDNLLVTGTFFEKRALRLVREWYFKASWYDIYDILQYLLSSSPHKRERDEANALLRREGSAYRFIGSVMAPITNDEELAEVDAAIQHSGPFHLASEHIEQAVTLLSDLDNPDVRNAIKESISAVESAVTVASGDKKADIEKGLRKLKLHSQLAQAWINMYNWTSDEEGLRHAMKEPPHVRLAEARCMVVACSAFVNYLIARNTEGNTP